MTAINLLIYFDSSLKEIIGVTTFEIGANNVSDLSKVKKERIEKEFEQLKTITDYDPTHGDNLYTKADGSLNRYSDILPCKNCHPSYNNFFYVHSR